MKGVRVMSKLHEMRELLGKIKESNLSKHSGLRESYSYEIDFLGGVDNARKFIKSLRDKGEREYAQALFDYFAGRGPVYEPRIRDYRVNSLKAVDIYKKMRGFF